MKSLIIGAAFLIPVFLPMNVHGAVPRVTVEAPADPMSVDPLYESMILAIRRLENLASTLDAMGDPTAEPREEETYGEDETAVAMAD